MIKTLRFFLAYIFCLGWVFIWETLTNYLDYPHEVEIEFVSSQYIIFYTFIFAPIWEELAYRYAPIEITKVFGEKAVLPVIILSSCAFGWGHGGHEGVLLQGVLGLIFSWIYVKNGLLWSILLHSLYNISVTI